jgi:intracellular sulfur oxidation DsrE/DsrF family protein
MRKIIMMTALAMLTVFSAGCATMFDGGKQKAVYHINYDDEKLLGAALRNVNNHIKASGAENVDIKIVMHGKGVTLLKIAYTDLDMQQKVIGLKKNGVAFQVCNNTLVGKKIDYKNDLFDVSKADIVPSGVAELAILQAKGYAYIKP